MSAFILGHVSFDSGHIAVLRVQMYALLHKHMKSLILGLYVEQRHRTLKDHLMVMFTARYSL